MRLDVVLRYLGLVLVANGMFLLVSAAVSVAYGDESFRPLLYSSMVSILFGIFPMIFVPNVQDISYYEGLMIVVAGWLVACLFGALPFVLWGGEFDFTNSLFESVSGFTTTGASILTDIESLPHGLLFWRGMTHWIGGMGIVLFVIAVLPSVGNVGMVLYHREVSSLARSAFQQSARTALRIMMTVYVGLTLAETLALAAAGMSLFDALTHSFATIATGGFSPRNASVAYYNSISIEIIIIVFMVISGISFSMLFASVVRRDFAVWKSTVVRFYVAAMAVGVVLVSVFNHGAVYDGWTESVRYSVFQVISIGTSTGFANADSSIWPPLAQIILMLFALQCACAGSTSGGIKADRIVILWLAVRRRIRQLLHPHAVISVFIDGESVPEDTLASGVLYITLYVIVVTIASMVLTGIGVDAIAAFSGTVAMMGNVGPGLGDVGSVGNYGDIPTTGKWIFMAVMLLGRFEIYSLLMLLSASVWRSRQTVSNR